jgi:hypothetical protein
MIHKFPVLKQYIIEKNSDLFLEIIGLLPLYTQSNVYDSLVHRCDYIYTNIIGPTYDMVEDIHFLTLAKHKEIVFNIISSNDRIIQDKSRFEKCIYMAYENLTKTEA